MKKCRANFKIGSFSKTHLIDINSTGDVVGTADSATSPFVQNCTARRTALLQNLSAVGTIDTLLQCYSVESAFTDSISGI